MNNRFNKASLMERLNLAKVLLRKILSIVVIGTLTQLGIASSVTAQDSTGITDEWANRFLIRGRLAVVMPESSAKYNLPVQTDVDNQVIPEIDLTYFFTDNFAVETICCVTSHKVSLAGGPDIGKALLVPLSAIAQYHFHPKSGVKPYIGLGPTLTVVASDKATGPATAFDLDKYNLGFVMQAGIDIKLKDNWYFNADVKKFALNVGARATVGGTNVFGNASLDPLIASIGIGRKF